MVREITQNSKIIKPIKDIIKEFKILIKNKLHLKCYEEFDSFNFNLMHSNKDKG